MKLKKYISCFIALILFTTVLTGNKTYASSIDSSDRLKNLGIIDITANTTASVTREDFVKTIVNASGLEDEAYASIGSTIFSDIKSGSTLSGYVNTAVKKGLMLGMADKKFHPETKMNFGQVCSYLVKLLGYKDTDVQGVWPNNYINKAKSLGITEDITLQKGSLVPLWAFASMLDKVLDSNIKTANGTDANTTFADASGLTSESYKYGLIANPIYSKPVVASGVTNSTTYIGGIYIVGQTIIKDGQSINVTGIEDNDVVYQVSDASGTKRYILVVDNKISGKITSLSSSQIQLDNKDYKYGSSFDYHSMLQDSDSLKTGDYATVLLGYDGKVVDYFDVGQQDNGDYAVVVNYTTNSSNYNVRLLMVDGNIREYYVASNPYSYKGRLVKYTKTSSDTVTLSYVTYSANSTYTINRDKRKMDNSYVSHNAKIFNIVADNAGYSSDAEVYLSSWNDFASSTITSGQILHVNTAGTYGDINVIVVKDLSNSGWKTGIVKEKTAVTTKVQVTNADNSISMVDKISSYNYSIVVDGTVKSYKYDSDIVSAGQVIKVKIVNNNIDSISTGYYTSSYGYNFEAADVNKIRINSTTYYLGANAAIYFRNSSGDYTLKTISDITAGKQYQLVSIYLDYYDDSRVAAIVINQ